MLQPARSVATKLRQCQGKLLNGNPSAGLLRSCKASEVLRTVFWKDSVWTCHTVATSRKSRAQSGKFHLEPPEKSLGKLAGELSYKCCVPSNHDIRESSQISAPREVRCMACACRSVSLTSPSWLTQGQGKRPFQKQLPKTFRVFKSLGARSISGRPNPECPLCWAECAKTPTKWSSHNTKKMIAEHSVRAAQVDTRTCNDTRACSRQTWASLQASLRAAPKAAPVSLLEALTTQKKRFFGDNKSLNVLLCEPA